METLWQGSGLKDMKRQFLYGSHKILLANKHSKMFSLMCNQRTKM